MTVELRVKEIGEADFVVPGRIRQAQSVVNIAKEASCKVHGAEGGAVGSVPDFFRECDYHHAQCWTQWGAHRGSTNLFKNSSANGKLSHLQRHKDDAFNVPNEDLPGHIECTARAAFDYVACGVARSCLHGDDLVGAGTHESREELQGQSPASNEAVSVDACEKAREILVVYARSRERIKVGVLEELDEIKYITFCQVVGKRLGQEVVDEFGGAVQHGSERCREEADNGSPSLKLFLPLG